MIKYFVSICILFFYSQFLFSNINEYQLEFITLIKNGKNEGELGYQKILMPHNPTCFTIANEGLIYVCDSWNKRIQVFDHNLNFKKIFTDSKKIKDDIFWAFKMKIDEFGNVILSENIDKLVKINSSGNLAFSIENKLLPDSVTGLNIFYPWNNSILFYNDENKLQIIDEKAKILDPVESMKTIKSIGNKNLDSSNGDLIKLKSYADSNNLIFLNQAIYPNDIYYFVNHIKNINNIFNKNTRKTDIKGLFSDDKPLDYVLGFFLGNDNSNNLYYKAGDKNTQKGVIIVFSKFGEILDCFYNNFDVREIEVAPDGDLYFMKRGTGKGFEFYKITRRW